MQWLKTMVAFILAVNLQTWAEFDMNSWSLPHAIIRDSSNAVGCSHLKAHSLLTHMSDGWHWLWVGTFMTLWPATYMAFPCGCLASAQYGCWVPRISIPTETAGQKLDHLLLPNLGSHWAYFCHITFIQAVTEASPISIEGEKAILLDWVVPGFW